MAQSNNTRTLNPADLQDDLNTIAALEAMTGYSPANAALSVANLKAKAASRKTAEDTHTQAINAEKSARDDKVAKQWSLHDDIVQARQNVLAQFGPDSNEAQSVGLKKKSERAKPKPKAKPKA